MEACCGTHCDRSSEIGWVRLIKSSKIQDGIVRIYFVAGKKTMEKLNYDTGILNELCRLWSIDKSQLVETGERFFKEYKVDNIFLLGSNLFRNWLENWAIRCKWFWICSSDMCWIVSMKMWLFSVKKPMPPCISHIWTSMPRNSKPKEKELFS